MNTCYYLIMTLAQRKAENANSRSPNIPTVALILNIQKSIFGRIIVGLQRVAYPWEKKIDGCDV